MMHGLILAGGRGSRLAADGVATPKALVEIAGRPQIAHLIETFSRLGCVSITCMVRDDIPLDWAGWAAEHGADVRRCRTPSSLHTLVAGLAAAPPGPVFCAMVDTVMPAADWQRLYRGVAAALDAGAHAALAITPFAEDDHPLYVERGAAGQVLAISDDSPPRSSPRSVTGGVYGFAPAARRLAAVALGSLHRMRAFLKLLVEIGAPVRAVEVPRIIDLDHKRDLEAAAAWLAAAEA